MIILDIPRKTNQNGNYIDIPVYHRTHLGLSSETAVHYCLFPSRPSHKIGQGEIMLPEMIIAPFPFENWDKIWRFTVSFTDRPGLFQIVCDAMARFDASIIASESSIMEEQGMFHIEMIIRVENEEKLKSIEWYILTKLFDNIGFLPDGSPRMRIRRVHNLWQVKKLFDQQNILFYNINQDHHAFKPYINHGNLTSLPKESNKPHMLRLHLPKDVRDILRKTVAEGNDFGYHLRISDTKDRFLRVLFFKSSDTVIHIRIEHNDVVGALSHLSDALKKYNFNLLTVLSIPSELRSRAITEFVVRAIRIDKKSTADIKELIEYALSCSIAAKDLSLKIGYPDKYAVPWKSKELNYINSDDSELPRSIETNSDLYQVIQQKNRELAVTIQNGTFSSDNNNKFILSQRLISQYEALIPVKSSGSLFISCHYSAKHHLELAKKIAESMGFEVITGEHLSSSPNIIEGVIRKIKMCPKFLGIWTEAGAQKIGRWFWPSPWLHWELGVTSAFHSHQKLLISNLVSKDAWAKLDAFHQHILFDDADFESKLHLALLELSRISHDRFVPFLQSNCKDDFE